MEMIDKINRVAETYCRDNPPEKMNWSWGEALVMYSLSKLDDLSGEKKYFNYYKTYTDHHYEKGIVVDQSDTCAPALIANELYKKTDDPRYREMVFTAISYLKNEPRLVEDLINHFGHSRDSRDYPKSIWVDSLMMSGVFGSIAASEYDDPELMAFALKQPGQFAKYLRDEDSGLYHHSWWKILKSPYPRNLFWGRGNGWVVASLALMYRQTGDAGCKNLLEDISRALLPYQRADYYFDTVINKPGDNYRESSATALIAGGWLTGIRNSALEKKYLNPAVNSIEAVISNIRFDGDNAYMTETSWWTIPMFLMPYRFRIGPYPGYKYIKTKENIPYGVASLIMAVTELESLKKEQPGLFSSEGTVK